MNLKIRYKAIQVRAYTDELFHLSFLNKKVWLSLGDSLTKPCMYQSMVNKSLKMKIINNGISGSTMADNGNSNSMCIRFFSDMPAKVDFITIMCGTNDFSQNIKIGSIKDSDPTTFYGGLKKVVGSYKRKYPNAKIFLLSPPKRIHKNEKVKNLNGDSIKDFAHAMKVTSESLKVEFIDVCNDSGIEKESLDIYTLDNVHLNIEGFKKVANLILNELETRKTFLA